MEKDRKRYYPNFFQIELETEACRILDLLVEIHTALSFAQIGAIKMWKAPMGKEFVKGGGQQLKEAILQVNVEKRKLVELVLEGEELLRIFQNTEGGWTIRMDREISADNIPENGWLYKAGKFVSYLFRHRSLQQAVIMRRGSNGKFKPHPPIARDYHLVMTTMGEVNDKYDNPAAFWRIWEGKEELRDKVLLHRALNCLDDEHWIQEILDDQWDLARAAGPKQTRYYQPQPESWELDIFNAGESTIRFAGYQPTLELIEYTAFVPSGKHITIRDFYEMRQIALYKKDGAGRSVKTIRVLFAAVEMAEREKRPLLDVGVQVAYLDSFGNLKLIEN